jgi:hypothetical protein
VIFKVTYPNIDDLDGILKNKGRGSLMSKKDLKRAIQTISDLSRRFALSGF